MMHGLQSPRGCASRSELLLASGNRGRNAVSAFGHRQHSSRATQPHATVPHTRPVVILRDRNLRCGRAMQQIVSLAVYHRGFEVL